MIEISVLLGGLSTWGFENQASSALAGMNAIADLLKPFGNVTTYPWRQWQKVKLSPNAKNAVVGYSGGGSRATYLVNFCHQTIDLLIAIDPSPSWQVSKIGNNVKKAICFKNSAPMMPSPFGMLGGGDLVGDTNIITIPITMQHLFVPRMAIVRERTVQAVLELAKT